MRVRAREQRHSPRHHASSVLVTRRGLSTCGALRAFAFEPETAKRCLSVHSNPPSTWQDARGVNAVRKKAANVACRSDMRWWQIDAGIRDVAIPPHVVPLIEAHVAKFVGADRDSLIFNTQNGGHLQPSTLYRHWYRARDDAGSPDLRFHDLRHSGAVLAASTGASLAELMGRLGHSTPHAAMRYQHTAQGRDREIAALLSKLADA